VIFSNPSEYIGKDESLLDELSRSCWIRHYLETSVTAQGQGMADQQAMWVTRIIERTTAVGLRSPLLANLVTIGVVPLVLTVLFFNTSRGSSQLFVLGQILLAVLLSAMGYLIWYYDMVLLPEFITDIEDLVEKESEYQRIRDKYLHFFRNGWWKTMALYGPLSPLNFALNFGYYQSEGVGAAFSLSFLTYFSFGIWTGIVSSLGIHLVLTTLLLVGEISQLDLAIDPLHYDGVGGMGIIGEFCVRTMIIASLGALMLPYAFGLARGGSFELFVYLGVGAYLVILIGIFVYPTYRASQQAEKRRETQLQELREEINQLENTATETEQTDGGTNEQALERELRLNRLRKKYKEYQTVRLYPISISTLARFTGSVLLPLFFLGLDYYLSNLAG